MKRFLCKLTLVVLVLSILANVYFYKFEKKSESEMSKREAVLANIFERKSVRKFEIGKKIPKEDLEILVKTAMAAPTARNLQPWAFIIVDNREILDAFSEKLPYAKMAKEATAAIVVCGDLRKAGNEKEQQFWIQDCSAATENLLLAAEAMGYGAVWTAAFPGEERVKAVRDILNLPENLIPLNVIPLGVPTGIEKPKDKWKPENLFWNKF